MLQYLPYLEYNGFQVTVSSLFDDQYLTSFIDTVNGHCCEC